MTLILFIVSLCALSFFVVLKAFELKWSRAHFLSSFLTKSDDKLHRVINKVVFFYNRYKKISKMFIFDFLPSYVFESISRFKAYLSKKYHEATDEFRGRRVIQNSSSVSFFLDRLSDGKSKIDGGSI